MSDVIDAQLRKARQRQFRLYGPQARIFCEHCGTPRADQHFSVCDRPDAQAPYGTPEAPQGVEEAWLPVSGSDGQYEISDQGRVRSVDRVIECAGDCNRGPYKKRIRGKVLSTAGGNPYVTVYLGKSRNNVRVHVLVLEAFVGVRPEGWHTRHLNGNHTDNRLENLAWGTPQENSRDTVAHGRNVCSQKSYCVNGHEFTDENTARYVTKNGHNERRCKRCASDYYQRKGKA